MPGPAHGGKGSPTNLMTKTSRFGEESLTKLNTEANDSKHVTSKDIKEDTIANPLSHSHPVNNQMENAQKPKNVQISVKHSQQMSPVDVTKNPNSFKNIDVNNLSSSEEKLRESNI